MNLDIIQNENELKALAEEWNDLLTCCSASHVPFLRNEYLSTWWETRGGGEWLDAELFLVSARQDGELVGVAPLFFSPNLSGTPAMLLLGSIEISDYLDLIANPAFLPDFIEALFNLLDSPTAPPWRLLDWYNIPQDSPTLPILEEKCLSRGWSFIQQPLQHCPYIPLPGDWETYLAGIDKKQRHEIRRKIRRAEESADVRWYIVEAETSLKDETDAFLNLMAQDPEKKQFLSEPMRKQMHASAQAAFQNGWLQLAFLEINGQKAAGYFNFDYNGHIWVYNSGLNFELREFSPGWVLLGYLLRWANENNRLAFDFMRGDEDYKYRFGALDRRVMRVTIERA